MPKLFGTLPVGAINAILNVLSVIKNLALKGLNDIANALGNNFVQGMASQASQAQGAGSNWLDNVI